MKNRRTKPAFNNHLSSGMNFDFHNEGLEEVIGYGKGVCTNIAHINKFCAIISKHF